MFDFTKIYDKINWRNKPDKTTPIDATNLGKIDTALDTIDNRVVELGNKANSVDSTLGDADISAIGDGTVKGGLVTLNDNLTSKLGTSQDWYYATNVAVTGFCSACVVNNIAYITMEITPTQITHGTNLVSNLPCPHKQIQTTLPGIDGSNYPVIIDNDGRILVYYPTSTTLERIDYTFSYPL